MEYKYILEAVLVGVYSSLLGILPVNFAVIGFIKHFVSYFIGIYNYYCRYGAACTPGGTPVFPGYLILIMESLGEAALFYTLGKIFDFKFRFILLWGIGFGLHIIFELIGVHTWFCHNRCETIKK
jgi:hypothetical protein